ncbi:MAG: class I SAM-dependent methyltransferase [Candidatus Omnitrophota bacterium]
MEAALVKKINRYFHDEEARSFQGRHETRMKKELILYRDFFKNYFDRKNKPVRILDVGAGTGLVAKAISGYDCYFVCVDISYEMLNAIRSDANSKSETLFAVSDAEEMPFKRDSFDIITCNAAMHHFPSISAFARELDRVLVAGGTLIIGFESNRRFWTTKPLSFLYRMVSRISLNSNKVAIGYETICENVNERLIRENAIAEPLSKTDILKHVDAHSPNAGEKIDYSKGFDVAELTNNIFQNYKARVVYHYEGTQAIVRLLNRLFFPKSAPQFSLILEKR